MNKPLEDIIKTVLKARRVVRLETIQALWSGYGELVRVLVNDEKPVIAKHINPPKDINHPRGWNTSLSHDRKLKSYQIEQTWYKQYAQRCDNKCKVPKMLFSGDIELGQLLLLEDLDELGYHQRRSFLDIPGAKLVLEWLAFFHATFLNEEFSGLWPTGTYWHLATRPDEYETMPDGPLKKNAKIIDSRLNACRYKTIVHGDAKVANFCFDENMSSVAAVDFQYAGGGCGIKDVAYFLGSCLSAQECELYEQELLDHYFSTLHQALVEHGKAEHYIGVLSEWTALYDIAWTDFTRFLLGWMPSHRKLNAYSDKLMKQTIDKVT